MCRWLQIPNVPISYSGHVFLILALVSFFVYRFYRSETKNYYYFSGGFLLTALLLYASAIFFHRPRLNNCTVFPILRPLSYIVFISMILFIIFSYRFNKSANEKMSYMIIVVISMILLILVAVPVCYTDVCARTIFTIFQAPLP